MPGREIPCPDGNGAVQCVRLVLFGGVGSLCLVGRRNRGEKRAKCSLPRVPIELDRQSQARTQEIFYWSPGQP